MIQGDALIDLIHRARNDDDRAVEHLLNLVRDRMKGFYRERAEWIADLGATLARLTIYRELQARCTSLTRGFFSLTLLAAGHALIALGQFDLGPRFP